MRTYAERQGVGSEHLEAWRAATLLVARVSDEWGNELRCHELARAAHAALPPIASAGLESSVRVADGKCGPCDHSWLVVYGRSGTSILDVYAAGRMPPVILVDPIATRDYSEGDPRTDIRDDVVQLLIGQMTDFIWPGLTHRETQVAEALARGATNREIAERFGISVRTVDTHRSHVLKKLSLRNNAELSRFASLRGRV